VCDGTCVLLLLLFRVPGVYTADKPHGHRACEHAPAPSHDAFAHHPVPTRRTVCGSLVGTGLAHPRRQRLHMYAHIFMCLCMCMWASACVCGPLHVYVGLCMSMWASACVCVCVCACMCMWASACVCVCACMCMYAPACSCVCACMCMWASAWCMVGSTRCLAYALHRGGRTCVLPSSIAVCELPLESVESVNCV
jgi:hypothetical protein